jgi:hypothetical protein
MNTACPNVGHPARRTAGKLEEQWFFLQVAGSTLKIGAAFQTIDQAIRLKPASAQELKHQEAQRQFLKQPKAAAKIETPASWDMLTEGP